MWQRTAAPPPAPAEAPANTVGATYDVVIHATPAHAEIEMDGVVMGKGTFATAVAKDGTAHEIVVSCEGYVTRHVTFRDAAPVASIELRPETVAIESATPQPPRVVHRRPRRRTKKKAGSADSAAPAAPQPTPSPRPTSDKPQTDNRNPWD